MEETKNKENAFIPGVLFGLALAYLMRYARQNNVRRKIIDATHDLQKYQEKPR